MSDSALGATHLSPKGPIDMAHHFNTLLAIRGNRPPTSVREMDMLTDALLRDAVERRVSDIHIEPMDDLVRVRFRCDGELLDAALLAPAQGSRLLNHFKAVADLNPGHLFRPLETRLTYVLDDQELDLRLAVIPCLDREAMVIRVLLPEMLEQHIASLGLNQHQLDRMRQWLESSSGMLLSAGPTGSGKTTTLYSLLHELSQRNRAIFSIEDPPEYEISGINQMRVDEAHHLTYTEGLKAILRMDPDFIMLGEIRDAPGAEAALTAANRGTVVLSTIHSRDPFGVVSTFRHWHLPNNEIAVSLNMLIAQRLVRRLCPQCRYEDKPTDEQRRWLTAAGVKVPARIWQAGSCEACRGLGYDGRTGIFEIWQLDETDYEAILSGMDEHALRRQVHDKGYESMLDDGLDKVERGITTADALRSVPDLLSLRALVEHSRKRTANGHTNTRTANRQRTSKKKTTNAANDGNPNGGKRGKRSAATSQSQDGAGID